TRDNDDADVVYSADTTFDLAHLIYRSDLRTYLAQRTLMERMLPLLPSEETVRASYAAATLAGLRALHADEAGRPTFVIAHVLMPHTPFVVDASCRPVAKAADGSLASELRCLNRETLQTVRALQSHTGTPPIIIVTGDHGTQSLRPFESDTAAPTEAQARERFRAFGAYYLPDGGSAAIPDSLSLVNVLRYVFGYYFGADLPPLPNTMFFSHWRVPYRLTELTDDFHVARLSRVSRYSAVAR